MGVKRTAPGVSVECPDCGEAFQIRGDVRLGRRLTCPNCDAELEIIETDPVEVDWYYEESDDDEQEEW